MVRRLERLKQKVKWKWKAFRIGVRNLDRFQIILLFNLTLLSIFMLIPLIYLLNHAFKPFHELFLFPPNYIVRNPTFQNFVELATISRESFVPVSRYIFNSVVVTIAVSFGMIITSALCAFPLSKHKFPGRKIIFSTIIISLLFVAEVLAIPRYVVVEKLGIMNTYWGHIFPIMALPVGVFLLKQFMDQIPGELLQAAKIDGANEFTVFLKVVVPVVMPAMATVGILSFQASWGNVETSTLFMQDEAMKTLPFYMAAITANLANAVARQGAAAAGAMIMFLPQLIIFLFFQRKVIATMAHSGIK
jgi:ABC-type glycerol-3-phosphate transport system permease component